ncbi:MAG: lysophospholipid acyltransferase family protein [Acidobacteriota bacterium]
MPASLLNNPFSRLFCRSIFLVSNRCEVMGLEHLPKRHDGVILACTHLSHYDPFCISTLSRRHVEWMARIESFKTPMSEWLTRNSHAFAVDRFGFALPGIREALRRLDRGGLVGIFPEGEVMDEQTSALTRGELKAGVGLLARRSGAPVIPCVVLNSQQFSNVTPWLPLRAGRLWVGFGPPLHADAELPHGRDSRWELTQRLHASLREVYSGLLETYDVPPEALPRRAADASAPAAAA